MRAFRAWIAVAGCVALLAACGDDDAPPAGEDAGTDAGTDAGSTDASTTDAPVDRCEGRTRCDSPGTSCDGDSLVTCGVDSDGCMVAIRTDCAASGNVCHTLGTTSACFDPCSLIAEADRCDTDGSRRCVGNTLQTCGMDEHGCLVRSETPCDASAGGRCDPTAGELEDTPMCVIGADPCDEIPAEQRCDSEGASCVAGSLQSCAPNAFGCLVRTTTPCNRIAGGTCDESGAIPQCQAPNACAGIRQCAAPGTSCDGPTLVTCAPNAFGCLVETEVDCTDTTFGFCDVDADPAARCSTAASDPCMGVEECGTRRTRTCADRGTLRLCDINAFGCWVPTDTDCRADGNVCDPNGGSAICVDPCLFAETCAAPVSCDGADIVTCAPDADGCFVESERTRCEGATRCVVMDGEASCSDGVCPEANGIVLGCDTGTITGTTVGGTTARDSYSCASGTYPGPERIYRFQHTGSTRMAVRIVAERAAGSTADMDLIAWRADDASVPCTASTLSCLGASVTTEAIETIEFLAEPGANAYVAYDVFNTTATAEYALTVTCRPIVCGDGLVAMGEACDDHNTTPGDGCSATCTVEPTFSCSGEPSVCVPLCGNGEVTAGEACDDGNRVPGDGCTANCTVESGYTCVGSPSVCRMPEPHGFCAGAREITETRTLTGESPSFGGPRPTAASCGPGAGQQTLYYAVVVPPHQRVNVAVTPTFDAVMFVMNACDAAACALFEDDPEATSIVNDSDDPITRIVGVRPYGAGVGTYSISFVYSAGPGCGDGLIEGSETCDDANDESGDGCSSSCAIESGWWCAGMPSVCTEVVCGNSVRDYIEGCDDGNVTGGDGCSASCAREIAAPGASFTLTGDISASDPDYLRPGENCLAATTPRLVNHDAFTIENTGTVARTLRLDATWTRGSGTDQDGFLFVYRTPFNPSSPTLNCAAGDDDFNGVTASQIPSVTIAPGERLVVIATTYNATATIGGYSIVVTTL